MKKNGILVLTQTVVTCLIVLITSAVVYGVSLQEEFDMLCVQTQEAESLSLRKLQELVTECDKLEKKIEGSNDEKKKIMLFRLIKCRNFFNYFIDLKQDDNSSDPQ